MSKEKILSEAQSRLKNLSKYKISIANDFMKMLEEKESKSATDELLKIPGFYEKFIKATEQMKAGELYDFETIKRNV
ncbi:MAG: hypothetical protein ABI840_06030 [bacterium]